MENHGYLLCLVSVLYDPAIILTNAEYKIKSGKTVEVQTMVEKPHENFIARCNSSEAEQIVYGETRMSCIKETTRNLTTATNANEIVDTPRFFHGDSPARQFESGQQKGGNYFCSNCGCHATWVKELDDALRCPLVSLEDRVNTIMKPGTVPRANTLLQKAKALNVLSREQLEQSGFLCGHCTALLKLTDDWRMALDQKKDIRVLAIDLLKAFDSICHNLLSAKLQTYGLRDSAIELIQSYLSHRFQ